MNIKQAEILSGVSSQNIRFYERHGLIRPARNPENDYREYTEADILTLKQIRTMRMLDMPLEQIASLLNGRIPFRQAMQSQKDLLETRAQQLATAIRFCEELSDASDLSSLDVDEILSRMESPGSKPGLFSKWVDDYRKFSTAEHEKTFTFFPDGPVTNPQEFTAALLDYANQNNLNLVITKESMYPEFTIDGIEYTADRTYTVVMRVPVASVRCTAVHPEDFEPDIPESKKKLMKVLRFSYLLIPVILINLPTLLLTGWKDFLSTWEGWLVLFSLLSLIGIQIYRFYFFSYNENGKRNKG